MREIRVRAKCIEEGEHRGQWITGFGVHIFEGDEVEAQLYTTEGVIAVDPATVGQYTGLQDDSEDQAELFSGDIAQVEYEGETHTCKIEFFSGSFAFVADSLPDGYLYLSELAEYDRDYGWVEGTIKVGNRWDTPMEVKA